MIEKTKVVHKYQLDIKTPARATIHSCGYDIFSPTSFIIWPFTRKRVNTFLRVKFDSPDEFGMITATSSMVMRGLEIPNGSGIIDYDYYDTGKSFSVILKNTTFLPIHIKLDSKIGQMIIMKHCRMLGEPKPKARREGGFGSTNEKNKRR